MFPKRMANMKTRQSVGRDEEQLDHSSITCRSVRWYSHFGKLVFSYEVVYTPAGNSISEFYPNETKIFVHKKTQKKMVKNWK